jgi:gliding motility-associated-like protein
MSLITKCFLFPSLFAYQLAITQPEFIWAKEFKGTKLSSESKVVRDHADNIITAGQFSGIVDFDPGPGVFNLSSGNGNLFICKLSSTGNFLWACQTTSVGFNIGTLPLTIDSADNILIAGSFTGPVDFDPGPGIFKLTSNTNWVDLFILKLNSSGNFLWAKKTNSTGYLFISDLLVAGGSIYISGNLQGSSDFDPGPGVFNLNSASTKRYASFILKLDYTGNFTWAKLFKGSNDIFERYMAIDSKENVYTIGYFRDTIDFDPGPGIKLEIAKSIGIYISKVDKNGDYLWVKTFGGKYWDDGYSITVDAVGNLYAYGKFTDTVDFDPGPGTYNLKPSHIQDFFILKLDTSGIFKWAKQIEGSTTFNVSLPMEIMVDYRNEIYLTGIFKDTLDFDPGPRIYNLSSTGDYDGFIAKWSSDGIFYWATHFGAVKPDWLNSIYLDSNYLYASGYANGLVDFDPGVQTVFSFSDTNLYSYVFKWSICNSNSRIQASACDSFTFNNNVYKTSGLFYNIIANSIGCDSTIELDLKIINRPKAKFTLQSQAGCQYVEYHFTDSSTSDTMSSAGYIYNWNFGDGTHATINAKTKLKDIKHIYTQSGTYTVSLDFNNGFCNDTFSVINKVIILPAPKPGFTLSAKSGCSPMYIRLSDTITTDITSKEYDLGNGMQTFNSKNELDTVIQITSPGIHIVRQRLTGITGCITESADTIVIKNGLSNLDTVNVLFTTVTDSFNTFTCWNKLPNAVSYLVNNASTNDTFFLAANSNPYLAAVKYQISGVDSCGNKSAVSPFAQTIFLSGENKNFNEFALLQYTSYETWKKGVMEFHIEFFDDIEQSWKLFAKEKGNALSSQTNVFPDSSKFPVNTTSVCYRVVAVEQDGNYQFSTSNVVCIQLYPVIFLPNAFTPNGDGINDYYKPIGAGMSTYEFEIYDRWGALVYKDTPESKGWDGTFRGKPAEAGEYIFRLSAIGLLKSPATTDARVIERKGSIFLLR